MFAAQLDLTRLPVGLVGAGAKAQRRLDLLRAAGACDVTVYAPEADAAFALAVRMAGDARLMRRLPDDADIAGLRLLLVADVDDAVAGALAARARAHRVLVNVEDRKRWCDFHVPAQIRRGDLTLTVSTAGRSPTLAQAMKRDLDCLLTPEWRERLARLAEQRARLRADGASAAQVKRAALDTIAREGWLPLAPPASVDARQRLRRA